ncbi:hypothetical protein ACM66B_006616 [Microbotryomycetes sp. NB124-2]
MSTPSLLFEFLRPEELVSLSECSKLLRGLLLAPQALKAWSTACAQFPPLSARFKTWHAYARFMVGQLCQVCAYRYRGKVERLPHFRVVACAECIKDNTVEIDSSNKSSKVLLESLGVTPEILKMLPKKIVHPRFVSTTTTNLWRPALRKLVKPLVQMDKTHERNITICKNLVEKQQKWEQDAVRVTKWLEQRAEQLKKEDEERENQILAERRPAVEARLQQIKERIGHRFSDPRIWASETFSKHALVDSIDSLTPSDFEDQEQPLVNLASLALTKIKEVDDRDCFKRNIEAIKPMFNKVLKELKAKEVAPPFWIWQEWPPISVLAHSSSTPSFTKFKVQVPKIKQMITTWRDDATRQLHQDLLDKRRQVACCLGVEELDPIFAPELKPSIDVKHSGSVPVHERIRHFKYLSTAFRTCEEEGWQPWAASGWDGELAELLGDEDTEDFFTICDSSLAAWWTLLLACTRETPKPIREDEDWAESALQMMGSNFVCCLCADSPMRLLRMLNLYVSPSFDDGEDLFDFASGVMEANAAPLLDSHSMKIHLTEHYREIGFQLVPVRLVMPKKDTHYTTKQGRKLRYIRPLEEE